MTEDYPAYIDRRDAEIVKRLEEGTAYGAGQIQHAYKSYTDIRQDKTAKERQKELFKSPAFEKVRIGVFRYVGLNEPDFL